MKTTQSLLKQMSSITLQSEGRAEAPPGFKKNEVVSGKVLRRLSSEGVLLSVGGRRFRAKTRIPLPVGQVLRFRVGVAGTRPVLEWLPPASGALSTRGIGALVQVLKGEFWQGVSEQPAVRNSAHALPILSEQTLRSFFSDAPGTTRPHGLAHVVENSGLFFESKLKRMAAGGAPRKGGPIPPLLSRDFKGLLFQWLAQAGETGTVKRALSALQTIQLMNQSGSEEEGKMFLPLPLKQLDGSFTVGQLLLHLPWLDRETGFKGPQGEERNRKTFSLTFLLTLSALGPLRADLVLLGSRIEGRFQVVRTKAKTALEKGLPVFRERIEARGFHVGVLQCRVQPREVVTKPLYVDFKDAMDRFNVVA